MDEIEAGEIKSEFENALVVCIIGRNLRFEGVASQLQDCWGAHEGFRINDLGNGCFILFLQTEKAEMMSGLVVHGTLQATSLALISGQKILYHPKIQLCMFQLGYESQAFRYTFGAKRT